jgi:hypothetical protein
LGARRHDVRLRAAALALLCAACVFAAQAREEKRAKNAYYGAIAFHQESGTFGWASDRGTSREARLEALRQCRHEKCEIVGTVTRGCLALAKQPKKFAVQRGTTRQEAETKALRRCGPSCEIAAWTCTR